MLSKIAFVSPFPIFPATGGNRVRTLSMMKAAADMGHDVHFILLPSRQLGEFDRAAHEAAYGSRFHLLRRPAISECRYLARRAAAKTARKLSGSPFRVSSVDEIYFEPFTGQIRELDRRERFDVAIVQYVDFTRALEAFSSALRIVDTHDSFQGQMAESEERRGLLRADNVIAIQDAEAGLFREMLGSQADRVCVISHFIETGEPVDTAPCEGATFIGSDFRQNNASLTWFIEQVLPIIRSHEPGFRLHVAGSVGKAVPDAPGVVKMGRVPRFGDAFVNSPILVNCITMGTGIKIKLLEAFGAGLPVVSTALGVKGIDPGSLKGTVVVEDGNAAHFAEQTLNLFRDPARRARMAAENLAISGSWNALQAGRLASLLAAPAPSSR
ncbi:MAG: glycosyltransferase family 4 protein [Oricola sp.]